MKYMRDFARKLIGVNGNEDRSERERRKRNQERIDRLIEGRVLQAQMAFEDAINSMKKEY